MDKDLSKFYEESLLLNWELLKANPAYYQLVSTQSTYQKIDELYDLYVYFIEKQDYEACSIVKHNLDILNDQYKTELKRKGIL